MEAKTHFMGSKFQFAVPDAFNHEFTIRNFMLISNASNTALSIIYADNECRCKDGWSKWENIPLLEHSLGVTEEMLILFLKDYYKNYKTQEGHAQCTNIGALIETTFKWLD